MLRIAIVGCGKIADQHVEQIEHISDCHIVAVCDREAMMATQLQQRLNAPACFTDVQDLLDRARPDVVHITSPPGSHYPIGKQCLEAGCNVYVEKPFTLDFKEAEQLIELAERKNVKLTVGHNAQFSHAANRMRHLISEGYLGGSPVHIESYYCYDLSDPAYARSLLGDSHHWVRGLPGGLLQNTISHGISRVAEFLEGDAPEVVAYGFTSALLRSLGENSLIDELRVIIHDGNATAYFTFSSQMRPSLHQLRLFGPKNGLIVDENQQTVIKVIGTRYKSYLEQFAAPLDFAKQYIGNSLGNMKKFLRADFQAGYGMKTLIERFYRSIIADEPLPIPYQEILRTARIMDDIFAQLASAKNAVTAGRTVAEFTQHEL